MRTIKKTSQRRNLLTNDRRILKTVGKVPGAIVSLPAVRELLAMNPNTFKGCVDRLVSRKLVVCYPGYMVSITPQGRDAIKADLHNLVAMLK